MTASWTSPTKRPAAYASTVDTLSRQSPSSVMPDFVSRSLRTRRIQMPVQSCGVSRRYDWVAVAPRVPAPLTSAHV